MNNFQLNKSVVFLIFNRPDTTEKVFEAIRHAKPQKLLVVADGPRADHPEDAEKCAATRAIIDRVDWDCEVLTNYSDVNLGCKRRVSSGLDWVFDTVEEAIVLEDDCLPNPTFFRFCEELLDKYRNDERIGMISGNNFQIDKKRTTYSYFFSRYGLIWGWASWRRVWKNYCVDLKLWAEIRDGNWLRNIFYDEKDVEYWTQIFESVYQGKIDTWDYQWAFTRFINNYLTVRPKRNLVANIGFGNDATHTKEAGKSYYMRTEPMEFPILHVPFIIPDLIADSFIQKQILSPEILSKPLKDRAFYKIRGFLGHFSNKRNKLR